MAQMKITEAQALELVAARLYPPTRKSVKKQVFAAIRREHGIPNSTRVRVAVESPDNPLYRVIRNKHTGMPLDNGIPEPVVVVQARPAAVEQKGPEPAPAVKKAKLAAVPTKTAKDLARPAPKKAPAAPKAAPAKPAKAKVAAKVQPAPKAPAKTDSKAKVAAKVQPAPKAPAKTDSKAIDVRVSVNGKRVRIGKAKSEAEKAKMIAKYKKENGI